MSEIKKFVLFDDEHEQFMLAEGDLDCDEVEPYRLHDRWIRSKDHDAALAAKDARIGRLEWLLREVRFSTDSIMVQHQIDRVLEESK